MKALVTGTTGFVGWWVAKELIEQGHEVRALVRKTSDTRLVDKLKVEKAYGDLRDRGSLAEALQGIDWVFNVGALVVLWTPNPKELYEANAHGVRILIEEASKAGVKRVVHTSSISAVGASEDGRPVDEECIYNLAHYGDHYILSKYIGDYEATKMAVRGHPVVIVCPSMCIGPYDIKPSPTGRLVVPFLNRKMPGYPPGGMNAIYVGDTARGHILAAKKGRTGERYLLTNWNCSNIDLLKHMEKVTGLPAPKRQLSIRLLTVVGKLAEWNAKYRTRENPAITPKAIRMGQLKWIYDNTKAVKELGLTFRDIDEALTKCCHWFLDNGYVTNKKSVKQLRRVWPEQGDWL